MTAVINYKEQLKIIFGANIKGIISFPLIAKTINHTQSTGPEFIFRQLFCAHTQLL